MYRLFILSLLLVAGCRSVPESRVAGPWDLEALKVAPKAAWGARSNLVQEVFYEGEPFHGKPTRVFGYVGRPEGKGPFPGIVLVHGGGGKAFREWAAHWAQRGYVALAMDLAGNGPAGRLEDGGPDQSDEVKFRNFTRGDLREMWSYHAVAAVVRGHSLLLSLPEVDRAHTAITGISWGGYLTCIVAGIDHRFKAAVPVYGCGFLGENSYWKDGALAKMEPEARALWLESFDPSRYLAGVSCPILFVNGTHDFAYPLDSYEKSYRLVRPGLRHTSIVMKLPHGHIWTFGEVDAFVDGALTGKVFPRLTEVRVKDGRVTARGKGCEGELSLAKAEFCFTTDGGAWDKRVWRTVSAKTLSRSEAGVTAEAPEEFARDGVGLIMATTANGLRISSELFRGQ